MALKPSSISHSFISFQPSSSTLLPSITGSHKSGSSWCQELSGFRAGVEKSWSIKGKQSLLWPWKTDFRSTTLSYLVPNLHHPTPYHQLIPSHPIHRLSANQDCVLTLFSIFCSSSVARFRPCPASEVDRHDILQLAKLHFSITYMHLPYQTSSNTASL